MLIRLFSLLTLALLFTAGTAAAQVGFKNPVELRVTRLTYEEVPTGPSGVVLEGSLSGVVADGMLRGFTLLVGEDQGHAVYGIGPMYGFGLGLGKMSGGLETESSSLFLVQAEVGLEGVYAHRSPRFELYGAAGYALQSEVSSVLANLGHSTVFARGEGQFGPLGVAVGAGTQHYRMLAVTMRWGRRYVGVRAVGFEKEYGSFRASQQSLGVVAGVTL